MRKLFSLLVLVLVAVMAAPALAGGKNRCDAGDELVGPNCIHVTWIKVSTHQEWPFSKVYRVADKGQKAVVWDNQGKVTESRADQLIVLEHANEDKYGQGLYEYSYTWDAKSQKYDPATRTLCVDNPGLCD